MSSAFLAWRASRQTIGKPSATSSVYSQVVKGPVSMPMRTASGARLWTVAAMVPGSLRHLPRQTRPPSSSSTWILVSSIETSRPTYCFMAASFGCRGITGDRLFIPITA
jgi:hypothetical protein